MNTRCAIFLVLVSVVSAVSAKDITEQVKLNTDFDERVAAACFNKCGNRGKSTLDSITVTPLSEGRYKVVAKATAQYHEYREVPPMFGTIMGKNMDLKHAVKITAHGYLDASDCRLVVDKVDVDGDELGLAQELMGHQGSQHYLKGCRHYL